MASIIVDDETKLKVFLMHIAKRMQEKDDWIMFVDLEGVNLSRHGTVAIMQLLMPPDPIVYLIDVHVLGTRAFEVATADDTSIKSILESKTIFKVFFDIRNDSDALYAHFGINVAGIIDLQVIEFATRQPRGRFVNGLAKCIEKDLPYKPGWSLVKDKGRCLFAPEAGGKYEVFLERPMAADIVKYCEQDVVLMPQLLATYGPKLRPGVAVQIQPIVDERIRLSKSDTFNGKGRHMARGPNLAPALDHSNESTSAEMDIVCSAHLERLCRLDDKLLDDLIGKFDTLQVEQEQAAASDSGVSNLSGTGTAGACTGTGTTVTADTTLEVPTRSVSTEPLDNDEEDVWGESHADEYWGWRLGCGSIERDSSSERDFTACSAEDCGYCGKCQY